MDLLQFNPQAFFAKILWYLVTGLLCLIVGFFGGCQYKQNQWDAEKFREVEKTQKLEHQDSVAGVKKAEELRKDQQQAQESKDFVRERIQTRKPSVRIISEPTQGNSNLEVKTQPGTVKDETTNIYLTANFMQLYDVSIQPGNTELRTRTYQDSEGPTLDEGFEKVVIPNNQDCADQRIQLTRLIERIKEKQKIFQPAKGVF